MNKKTRAVIQQLVRACERAAHGVTGHRQEAAEAADAGKALLNPPIRFAWVRLTHGAGGGSGPTRYVADLVSANYTITSAAPEHGKGYWRATAEQKHGKTTHTLPSLKAAKQWCVDFELGQKTGREHGGKFEPNPPPLRPMGHGPGASPQPR